MTNEMKELIAVFDMLQQLGFDRNDLNVMVTPSYFGVLVEGDSRTETTKTDFGLKTEFVRKQAIIKLGPRTKSLGHYNELFKQACSKWNKLNQKQRQLFVEQTAAYSRKVDLVAHLVAAGLYPIASNDAKPFQNMEAR